MWALNLGFGASDWGLEFRVRESGLAAGMGWLVGLGSRVGTFRVLEIRVQCLAVLCLMLWIWRSELKSLNLKSYS